MENASIGWDRLTNFRNRRQKLLYLSLSLSLRKLFNLHTYDILKKLRAIRVLFDTLFLSSNNFQSSVHVCNVYCSICHETARHVNIFSNIFANGYRFDVDWPLSTGKLCKIDRDSKVSL